MIFKYPKSVNPEAKVASRCKLQNTKSSRKGSENVLRRNSISLKGQSTGCLIKFQMKENLKFTLLSLLLIRGAGNNVHCKPAREIMDCIISRAVKMY